MDLAGFDDTGNQVNITGVNNTASNTANGIGIGFFNATVDKATFGFAPAIDQTSRFRQQVNWSDSSVTTLTFSGRATGGSLVDIAQFQNDGTSVGATFYGGISVAQGIALSSHTPSSTTNKLYQNSGTLFWNGNQVGVGAINSVTNMADNRVLTASGANSINGEANLTFDGATLEVIKNGATAVMKVHEDAGTNTARFHIRRGTVDTFLQHRDNFFEIRTENNISTSNTPAMTIDTGGNIVAGYNLTVTCRS